MTPAIQDPYDRSLARRLRSWFPSLLSGLLLPLAFPAHPDHPLSFLFHPAWAWVVLVGALLSLALIPTFAIPYLHARLSALRAVETRAPIARCATGGISLFIDPYGRTFGETDLFAPTFPVGGLPSVSGSTFYTRHGDLFAQLALLIYLLAVALSLRPFPQKKLRP